MFANNSLNRPVRIVRGKRKELVLNISRRKWRVVQELLPEIKDFHGIPCGNKCCADCQVHHNILHFALQFSPPYRLVRQIVEALPESVLERNCMNRYPLQVALQFGTSSDVVKYLISQNREAAWSIDSLGKTPLHIAIDGYELLKIDAFHESMALDTMFEIIDTLNKERPSMIMRNDFNNISVIEHAIDKNVDNYILAHLQSMYMSYSMSKRKSKKVSSSISDKSSSSISMGSILKPFRSLISKNKYFSQVA